MAFQDESFTPIPVADFDDDGLRAYLRDHGLTLAPSEARKVADLLGRDPTLTEMTLFDTMWSEHCSYKSSRPHLKKNLPTTGKNVVVGPVEDAGIVDFGEIAGFFFGGLPQFHAHIHAQMRLNARAPGKTHRVVQPFIGGTTPVGDVEGACDALFVKSRPGGRRCAGRHRIGVEVEIEDFFLLATEHRQNAVRGHLGERLGELEIVGEVCAFGFLAFANLGAERAASPSAGKRVGNCSISPASSCAIPASSQRERDSRARASRTSASPSSALPAFASSAAFRQLSRAASSSPA